MEDSYDGPALMIVEDLDGESCTGDKSGASRVVASGQSEGLSCYIAPVYIDEYMFVTICYDQQERSYNQR